MPCIRESLYNTMVCYGNGFVSPLISTTYNFFTFTYTIHITHLSMAMKFNTLVYCCIFTLLCGKWRNRLHSVNTADFHLLIPCIIKGNTFNSHKRTFLYFLFKVLKHITVCQKHLNGNTVCKIGNFKSNNKLSCLCFSLIHCHNLTFYRAFSSAFKNITKVNI